MEIYQQPSNVFSKTFTSGSTQSGRDVKKPINAKGALFYIEATPGGSASLTITVQPINPVSGNVMSDVTGLNVNSISSAAKIIMAINAGAVSGLTTNYACPVPDAFRINVLDADGSTANTVRVDVGWVY